ncbi:hypothetical protein NMG60_11019445 [Bertholletia excelsa]
MGTAPSLSSFVNVLLKGPKATKMTFVNRR